MKTALEQHYSPHWRDELAALVSKTHKKIDRELDRLESGKWAYSSVNWQQVKYYFWLLSYKYKQRLRDIP